MTLEGVFIIIIFSVLLVFGITLKKEYWIKHLKSLKSSNNVTGGLFLGTSLFTNILVSNQAIGLLVINSLAWQILFNNFKKQGYEPISWWAITYYGVSLFATHQTFEHVPGNELWQLSALSWGVAILFLLIFEVLKKPYKLFSVFLTSIINIGLFTIPVIFVMYKAIYNTAIREGQINAIFQTSISESKEFISIYSNPLLAIALILLFLIPLILLAYQNRKHTNKLSVKSFVILSFTALCIFNIDFFSESLIYNLTFSSAEKYNEELKQFKKELAKRKAGEIDFTAYKKPGKELYVVIIGESHNKNHMSLYGYHRNTTPHLDTLQQQNQLVKFEQAFSNHVRTVPVLTFALTEANHTKKDYHNALSILDIQDAAGFETYWLSNQVAFGDWDNPISVLADRATHRFNFNTNLGLNTSTNAYDIDLVSKLNQILTQPLEQNTVIYIHLMGSHGGYKERYPSDFERFSKKLEYKDFGRTKYWDNHVNEYDNSVFYNDYVVSEIIKSTKQYHGISSCFYFADHSEDALHNRGHNESDFKFDMIQIPMFLWLSEEYKTTYPEKTKTLNSNTNNYFSNAFVYDFLIGLNGIITSRYTEKNDISNSHFNLSTEDCSTMHGKIKITEKDNRYYHTTNNIERFKTLDQSNRVYPHRINSLGKLSQILYNGCTSYELDLAFRMTPDSCYFEVGHDSGYFANMSFKEILKAGSAYETEKIWMDIKNLNENNIDSALSRLNILDNEFQIKKKVLVESSMTSSSFSKISKQGFNTSYYLPTGIKDQNTESQQKFALKIANQIAQQQTKSVSFDYELYPFVKEHLEPLIDANIEYHTWYIRAAFQDSEVIDELTSQKYYQDSRIKTILIKYHSDFEL